MSQGSNIEKKNCIFFFNPGKLKHFLSYLLGELQAVQTARCCPQGCNDHPRREVLCGEAQQIEA